MTVEWSYVHENITTGGTSTPRGGSLVSGRPTSHWRCPGRRIETTLVRPVRLLGREGTEVSTGGLICWRGSAGDLVLQRIVASYHTNYVWGAPIFYRPFTLYNSSDGGGGRAL